MRREGYLVVGFLMNLMLGTAYAWSVFAKPLKAQFGATDFTAMLPNGVALASFSVGMVLAGRMVDRRGPRLVALVGAALVGAGYLLSSLMAATPWPIPYLTLTYGGIMGLGIGFTYAGPIPTAAKWFPDRKGLATGLVVMGFGLSALITAPLLKVLIDSYGVTTTFLILGAVFAAGLLVLGSLLAFPPANYKAPAPKVAAKRSWAPVAEVDTRAMLRTRTFWLAWVMYALGTAAGFMVINKAQPIAEEIGLASGALAVAAVQLLAVFNSGGRPVFGRLADAWGPRRTLATMYVVLIGAAGVLAVSKDIAPLYLGIGLTGLVFGGFLAVMPALATYFFGAKNLGANYGLLFTGYGLGSLVALFSIGPLHDAYGNYVPAFYLAGLLGATGLALAFLLRPPKPVAVRVEPPVPAKAPA